MFKLLWRSALILVLLFLTIWGGLALWFRLPGPDILRAIVAFLFGLAGFAVIRAQFSERSVSALIGYTGIFAVLLAWWSTVSPPTERNWSPDVARQVTGDIDGDIVTLNNVRAFNWRSETDIDVNWVTRQVNLSELESVDMFMSYWGSPYMAHIILSFGFADGTYIAWSVEVRRELGGAFSPVADMFKANTLAIVAAEETDVVGVRSNVRGEDVQLFRLGAPASARALFEEYVRDANALAAQPRWYNSIFTNCTTVIFKMLEAIGQPPAVDWRIIVNGYLPEMAYENGAFNSESTLEDLRSLGQIRERALAAGLGSEYSEAIRVGVPVP